MASPNQITLGTLGRARSPSVLSWDDVPVLGSSAIIVRGAWLSATSSTMPLTTSNPAGVRNTSRSAPSAFGGIRTRVGHRLYIERKSSIAAQNRSQMSGIVVVLGKGELSGTSWTHDNWPSPPPPPAARRQRESRRGVVPPVTQALNNLHVTPFVFRKASIVSTTVIALKTIPRSIISCCSTIGWT